MEPVDEHDVLETATLPDRHDPSVEPSLSVTLPDPASSHERTVRDVALVADGRHVDSVEAALPDGRDRVMEGWLDHGGSVPVRCDIE